jgi:hypothetical protein
MITSSLESSGSGSALRFLGAMLVLVTVDFLVTADFLSVAVRELLSLSLGSLLLKLELLLEGRRLRFVLGLTRGISVTGCCGSLAPVMLWCATAAIARVRECQTVHNTAGELGCNRWPRLQVGCFCPADNATARVNPIASIDWE